MKTLPNRLLKQRHLYAGYYCTLLHLVKEADIGAVECVPRLGHDISTVAIHNDAKLYESTERKRW